MNEVYDKLKELTILQLHEFIEQVIVANLADTPHGMFMIYQACETIRRKNIGQW